MITVRSFEGFKRGVNLGGWLSQCGDNYNEEHYRSFITEEDIAKIASWGADHVRLPIDSNVIQNEDGSFIEAGFSHIDECLAWCEKYGLKTVLDLHKTAGYVFDDKNCCQFFSDEKLQDIFVRLWEELARRYGSLSGRVAFELLNEITARETAEIWNRISRRTVEAIRNISRDVRIIIGGIFNSSIFGLTLLDKPYDDNIVFTFHCYSPLIFTHQSAYWVENMPRDYKISYPGTVKEYREKSREIFGSDFDSEFNSEDSELLGSVYFDRLFNTAVRISEQYDVPLYCGEYGVIDLAECEDTLQWFKDINAILEKYGIARSVWSYKSMNFGLSDEHYAGILNELIKNL